MIPWSVSPSPQPLEHPPSLSPGGRTLMDQTPPSSPGLYGSQDLTDSQRAKAMSYAFVDGVKTIILHLLNGVVYKYWEEICHGCQINHPSQNQHDCLWGIPAYFYETKFEQLTERLWTDRFIPAIQRFLTAKRIYVDEARIHGAAEAILYELKSVVWITDHITKMYDTKIGDDYIKTVQLRVISDYWKGDDH